MWILAEAAAFSQRREPFPIFDNRDIGVVGGDSFGGGGLGCGRRERGHLGG